MPVIVNTRPQPMAGGPLDPGDPEPERRGLLLRLASVGAGLLALGWGWAALRAARPVERAAPRRVATGVRVGTLRRMRAIGSVVLVPEADGGVRAFHRRCPHLGCLVAPRPDDRGLECPCHHSRFDRGGRRLAGPAPGDLRPLRVTVAAGGEVIVHDVR